MMDSHVPPMYFSPRPAFGLAAHKSMEKYMGKSVPKVTVSTTFFFLSASTLTCDDMQLLGSGVTAMTTAQIETMSDTDFIDCAQTLGCYSTWDSNQLLSFLTVATRAGVSDQHNFVAVYN